MLQQENSQAFSCFRSSTKVPKFSSNAAFGTTWGLTDMLLPSGNPTPNPKANSRDKDNILHVIQLPKNYLEVYYYVHVCHVMMQISYAVCGG